MQKTLGTSSQLSKPDRTLFNYPLFEITDPVEQDWYGLARENPKLKYRFLFAILSIAGDDRNVINHWTWDYATGLNKRVRAALEQHFGPDGEWMVPSFCWFTTGHLALVEAYSSDPEWLITERLTNANGDVLKQLCQIEQLVDTPIEIKTKRLPEHRLVTIR